MVQLPRPVVVNSVHTDSRNFMFGSLELHSLDLSGEDGAATGRNLFWLQQQMPLFDECGYVGGRPHLQGYNPLVLDTFLAMYRSSLCL